MTALVVWWRQRRRLRRDAYSAWVQREALRAVGRAADNAGRGEWVG